MDETLALALENYALENHKYVWLKDLVESSSGKLVLNPGSGDGSPLTNLFYRHGAEIISLDLSLKNIRKNPPLKIQGNALYLPFRDNTFDFLISEALILDTFYSQNKTNEFIREVRRVLKPNGFYLGHECQVEYEDLISLRFSNVARLNSNFVVARKP